jgi:glycine betaine/choline ABC-type transport system substrate-binding protein
VAYDCLVKEGLIDPQKKGDGSAGTIKVGGKNFTEQDILAHMMATMIEHHTDIAVQRKVGLGGTMICFNALRSGDLDLYAEYTGTGLVSILDRETVKSSEKAFQIVEEAFQEKWNLVWLQPFGFNNTYTLTMRRKQAERLGIETISGLAEYLRTR